MNKIQNLLTLNKVSFGIRIKFTVIFSGLEMEMNAMEISSECKCSESVTFPLSFILWHTKYKLRLKVKKKVFQISGLFCFWLTKNISAAITLQMSWKFTSENLQPMYSADYPVHLLFIYLETLNTVVLSTLKQMKL